jgi:hypothetical protein
MAGAPWDANTNGFGAGAAYVFDEPLTGWESMAETVKLLATDADGQYVDDHFGYSVALQGSYGQMTAAIGAPHDDDNGDSAGAAYEFDYDPFAGWSQWQKLLASDGEPGDNFGHSVDMNGGIVVVGAPYDDDAETNAGSAYVFAWYLYELVERAKLLPCGGAPFDYFGYAVALGRMPVEPYWVDRVLVGVPMDDDHGDNSGSAYLFQWHDNDTPDDGEDDHWFHRAKLRAPDAMAGDHFGIAVAMSQETALIGAQDHDCGSGPSSGAAYVFAPSIEDCNTNGYPDECDIENGFSPDLNSNGVPDECECAAMAVRSYRTHGSAGELYLDMGTTGGVEPRQGGIQKLEIDLDYAFAATQVVAVNCWPTGWTGAVPYGISGTVGDTVTVDFSPALPDEACCTIELDCGAWICVRGLEGDVDRSGLVTTGDASIIKPKFGDTPTAADAEFDFDVSGLISTADFSQIKPSFGNLAPACP